MKGLDTTYKLFSPSDAERTANELKSNDPDWSYVVCHDPKGTGYSFIKVYDEFEEFVSCV
jgi:hypothetical protein